MRGTNTFSVDFRKTSKGRFDYAFSSKAPRIGLFESDVSAINREKDAIFGNKRKECVKDVRAVGDGQKMAHEHTPADLLENLLRRMLKKDVKSSAKEGEQNRVPPFL